MFLEFIQGMTKQIGALRSRVSVSPFKPKRRPQKNIDSLFKTSAGLKNEPISLSRAIRITTNLYKILEI